MIDKTRSVSLINRIEANVNHLLTHIDFVIGLLEPKEQSEKYVIAKKQMFKTLVMDSKGFLQELKDLILEEKK